MSGSTDISNTKEYLTSLYKAAAIQKEGEKIDKAILDALNKRHAIGYWSRDEYRKMGNTIKKDIHHFEKRKDRAVVKPATWSANDDKTQSAFEEWNRAGDYTDVQPVMKSEKRRGMPGSVSKRDMMDAMSDAMMKMPASYFTYRKWRDSRTDIKDLTIDRFHAERKKEIEMRLSNHYKYKYPMLQLKPMELKDIIRKSINLWDGLEDMPRH